jgi:hypothetical protein
MFTKTRLIICNNIDACRSGAVGWDTALQAERPQIRFPMMSLEFFIDIILLAAQWTWSRLIFQHKWVPGIFPGGKGGRCRSQWPRCLRHGSAGARLLGLWVRIPPGTWMSVSCECCVLAGRGGLRFWLITRPEESYWVWCVWVWSWIFDNEEALTH